MVPWALMSGRRIFKEFLGKDNPFVFEPQVYKKRKFSENWTKTQKLDSDS